MVHKTQTKLRRPKNVFTPRKTKDSSGKPWTGERERISWAKTDLHFNMSITLSIGKTTVMGREWFPWGILEENKLITTPLPVSDCPCKDILIRFLKRKKKLDSKFKISSSESDVKNIVPFEWEQKHMQAARAGVYAIITFFLPHLICLTVELEACTYVIDDVRSIVRRPQCFCRCCCFPFITREGDKVCPRIRQGRPESTRSVSYVFQSSFWRT